MSDTPPALRPVLTPGKLLTCAGVLACVTLAVGVGCSFLGVHWLTWDIWVIRLFRLAAAATVGAALAVAGMALQAMLRNPLAEPYILGISSGAGVGVLVGTVILPFSALAWLTTPVLALVGALVTCAVVYAVAQRRGRLNPYVLLLAGVIVNVFNGAVMMGLLLLADRNKILEFVRWSMGDLPQWIWAEPLLLAFCAMFVAGGWVLLVFRGAAFNALGLGDDVAQSTGVPVQWLRAETFIVSGLMTAAAVCLAGPIGFVGLIIPHICRLILGADHRRLAVFSGFFGAIFLMLADTLCRTVGPMLGIGKVPVGIITALAGGPFFIILLRRRAGEAQP